MQNTNNSIFNLVIKHMTINLQIVGLSCQSNAVLILSGFSICNKSLKSRNIGNSEATIILIAEDHDFLAKILQYEERQYPMSSLLRTAFILSVNILM